MVFGNQSTNTWFLCFVGLGNALDEFRLILSKSPLVYSTLSSCLLLLLNFVSKVLILRKRLLRFNKKKMVEEPSIKGRFGWTTFDGDKHVPHLYQEKDEKVFSLRMVDWDLFKEITKSLPPQVVTFFKVFDYFLTFK